MLSLLSGLPTPPWEGALCLQSLERVPCAFVSDGSPMSRPLLVLCVNQGLSASFSLLSSTLDVRSQSIKGSQQKLKQTDPLICSHHTFYSFMTLIYLSLSARLDYGLHEGGMVYFAYPCDFTESGTNQISIFVDHRNTHVSVDQDDRAYFWSTDISLPCFNKRIYVFWLSTWSVSYRLCVLAPTVIMGAQF